MYLEPTPRRPAIVATAASSAVTSAGILKAYFAVSGVATNPGMPGYPPHPLSAGQRFRKDRVTSPTRKPNLDIVVRFSIVRSSIRYIQSSMSMFQTWPSTGKAST